MSIKSNNKDKVNLDKLPENLLKVIGQFTINNKATASKKVKRISKKFNRLIKNKNKNNNKSINNSQKNYYMNLQKIKVNNIHLINNFIGLTFHHILGLDQDIDKLIKEGFDIIKPFYKSKGRDGWSLYVKEIFKNPQHFNRLNYINKALIDNGLIKTFSCSVIALIE